MRLPVSRHLSTDLLERPLAAEGLAVDRSAGRAAPEDDRGSWDRGHSEHGSDAGWLVVDSDGLMGVLVGSAERH